MFIGRERELETLEKLYKKDVFQMVVMYGRRRIGKTTIIAKFIENKPKIFFTAQEVNDKANLEQISKKIVEFFSLPLSTPAFKAWEDVFDFLYEKAKDTQFVLAFDEFPYAAMANKGLKSILQAAIDHKFINTKIFIILCGSSLSFMEKEVLGYKSPLYGRRTAQMKIEGFNYLDAAKLLSGFSNEDKIKFYACVGSTPHYLAQIDHSESFLENMKRLYFDISGYLYNEPQMLLQQECRELAMYNTIISAIANGATRLNEIASKTGEDSSKVVKYIGTLINLGIVKRVCPFGEDSVGSRKGLYTIEDNCYNFWYRFVFQNKPEIESGNGALVCEGELLAESLSTYISKPAFEEICKQFLIAKNLKGELAFRATSFGSWWGNDSKARKQTDVDIVAADRKSKKIILCECKWENQLDDIAEIKKLLDKTHLLSEYTDRYYYFISKTPFSLAAKEMERSNERLTLITLDEIFN